MAGTKKQDQNQNLEDDQPMTGQQGEKGGQTTGQTNNEEDKGTMEYQNEDDMSSDF